MNEFKDLIEERAVPVGRLIDIEPGPWYWLKDDTGAWDGPMNDWITQHKNLYFKHLNKRDAVVTAGGNQGMYTRFYSKLFKTVYTFEPDPINFHVLTLNNQSENVIKFNCALGEDSASCCVKRPHSTNTGMNSVEMGESYTIPILPLDAFNIPACDLLQLDVEGYEYKVLLGAGNFIAKHRPIVILENGQSSDITKYMERIDYIKKELSVSDTIWVPK